MKSSWRHAEIREQAATMKYAAKPTSKWTKRRDVNAENGLLLKARAWKKCAVALIDIILQVVRENAR